MKSATDIKELAFQKTVAYSDEERVQIELLRDEEATDNDIRFLLLTIGGVEFSLSEEEEFEINFSEL